jgi:hypothetical protein
MQQIRDAFHGVREDVEKLTRVLFWWILGSLSTMYVVAPEAQLTQQLLPLELGLLIGMGLVYISRVQEQPRKLGYKQEELL